MKNLLDKIDAQGGIGAHGEYLCDYMSTTRLTKLMELPEKITTAWLSLHPEINKNILKFNKSWVVVHDDADNGIWIILYNHDGIISLYSKEYI